MYELFQRCGQPFYSQLMGLNALNYPVPYEELSRIGQTLSDDDVISMLGSHWRPRVMGAWYAVGRGERTAEHLLQSLVTSDGVHTSPALAAVAVHELGDQALPALHAFLDVDLARGLGVAGFIGALLERVCGSQDRVVLTDWNRTSVAGMLEVAQRLASATAG